MLLPGGAVMVAVETRVVADGKPVELGAALEVRHRLTRRPIVRPTFPTPCGYLALTTCRCATVRQCERLRSRDRS
jgi:hypothetical protein